jgi:hypothetical protein
MERKGKLKLGIVIVVLAVTVMAGFGSVVYAASGNAAQLEDERGIFNPFTLSVTQVSSGSGSTAVLESVARPAIRIPVRPVLRSFFRPPLVNQTP